MASAAPATSSVQTLERLEKPKESALAGYGGELADKVLPIAAQKENAQRLPLPAELHGLFHLIVVFIQIVEGYHLAGCTEPALHLLDDARKEPVARALYDDAVSPAFPLFQLPGVVVWDKAQFLHRRQDLLPGGVTYAGAAVENAGYCAYCVTGTLGHVFDGHCHCTSLHWAAPLWYGCGLTLSRK